MKFWTEERLNRLLVVLIILLSFMILANFIKVDYFLTAPGAALALDQIITVEDGQKDARGGFYLTAVSSHQINLFTYLYVLIVKPRGIELSPKEEAIPPGITMEQYTTIMEDMMVESQMMAKVIALEQVGYKTKIKGDGARIVEIMQESKSKDLLQPDDVIIAVNGVEVTLSSEAVDQIRKYEIGEMITLTILRGEEKMNVEVETVEIPSSPGESSVGIYIITHQREYNFPIEIDIATENIIGPSAGTMFTLEIINQLTEKDITGGYQIAGTGTMDLEGRVGPISGVTQKVMAAENAGAQYFLAPVDNYEEAAKAATTIHVYQMATIDDALAILAEIRGETPLKKAG